MEIDVSSRKVLLVDDEEMALECFEIALRYAGIRNTIACLDSRKVIDMVQAHKVDLVLLDLIMPHRKGIDILEELSQDFPHIPVIMITGTNDVKSAVQCMQRGAFDYQLKPLDKDRLIPSVKRALELIQLRSENQKLTDCINQEALKNPDAFSSFHTRNKHVQGLFRYCEAIAESSQPVLVTGDTGVGKDLIANALHQLSCRAGKLVSVNVAGLDDNAFADSLFGHEKGAYTSADRDRKGLIEQAAGGTLFLDEIGDLSTQSQVKLLRLLEQREYYALGADTPKKTDARIIVATNRNLKEQVREGSFRNDLYFRLNIHRVDLPPLRERRSDIPLLFDALLEEAAADLNKAVPEYGKDVVARLNQYAFPGNIRELRAMVYDLVSRVQSGMITADQLGVYIEDEKGSMDLQIGDGNAGAWLHALEDLPSIRELTDILIDEAMERADGNTSMAANLLGITRQGLASRLKRSSIDN